MPTNAPLDRKLRMGLIGGGQGAFIGRVHATAAVLDNRAALVAGALSSDPKKAKDSAPDYDIPADRAYGSYKEMAEAEKDEATATKNLKTASDHFTMWQKKGGHALEEAEKAAGVAGLALGAVAISDPPLAGAIDSGVDGVSGTATATWFKGFSVDGGGGWSALNWQGLFQAGDFQLRGGDFFRQDFQGVGVGEVQFWHRDS